MRWFIKLEFNTDVRGGNHLYIYYRKVEKAEYGSFQQVIKNKRVVDLEKQEMKQICLVATQLLNDFTSIRFGLLVGIGGGIPGDDEDDIRPGDVVVSKPTATFGGVVHCDRGKIHPNRQFERTGTLKKPPTVLMAIVQRLEAQHRRIGNQISKYLSEMLERFPNMEEEYLYPGMEHDQLFEATYSH
jgi:hypothetical protein